MNLSLCDIKNLLKENGAYETNDLNATYYVLEDGSQWSFGYDEYCGRTDDHRAIFGCFEEINYNDFTTLLEETGILGYCPETNTAWCLKSQSLTLKQREFIRNNAIEVEYDI